MEGKGCSVGMGPSWRGCVSPDGLEKSSNSPEGSGHAGPCWSWSKQAELWCLPAPGPMQGSGVTLLEPPRALLLLVVFTAQPNAIPRRDSGETQGP